MIGSEQHFRDTFGEARASALLGPLQQASDQAREIALTAGFVEARTEPTVAFDLSVKALGDFDQLPGVRRVYSLGQHLWAIDDTYALRVKKLGDGYRPSNHASGQQARIASFVPLDGMEPLVYVTAGVRYSSKTGLPLEYVVVKHYPRLTGKQCVEWVVDLEDLAAGGTAATTPILDLPGTPTAPAAALRRRHPTASDDVAGS